MESRYRDNTDWPFLLNLKLYEDLYGEVVDNESELWVDSHEEEE